MSLLDKFKFFRRNLSRILTPERFALAPIWVQLVAIFFVSAIMIIGLSPFLGDLPTSYKLFADPANYANTSGALQLIVGLIQVLMGLVLFSFIISVLSAALVTLIENIKSGSLPYKKKGHILFVNFNIKLPLILDQVNLRAKDKGILEDVVLLFPEAETVTFFRNQFDKDRWKNLEVFIRQGDVLSFQTFDRLSVQDAMALVILQPDHLADTFSADNFNLKILTTLTNNHDFFSHLTTRQEAGNPVKCSIELSKQTDVRKIALEITKNKAGNLFSVITPGDVIGSILARAKVDVVYYKVFFEVMAFDGSTIHFVNPKQFGAVNFETKDFHHLLFSFKGGTLIGFSSSDHEGKFELNLCPFHQEFKKGDWLIFLTPNVKQLKYSPLKEPLNLNTNIPVIPPTEEVSKKICVIGNAWTMENIEDFMDGKSLAAMQESQVIFDNPSDYFSDTFLNQLHEGAFDNIIVNLDDELGFRLTMMLVSSNKHNPEFLNKIVTILGDPVTEQLLNTNILNSNTVLSHKLSARYIAQLAFQKNLERIFTELAFTEGAEFHLLDVGKHIRKEVLKDVNHVRKILASHEMIYLGTVDADKNVNLEASNFEGTKQILVLAEGKITEKGIEHDSKV